MSSAHKNLLSEDKKEDRDSRFFDMDESLTTGRSLIPEALQGASLSQFHNFGSEVRNRDRGIKGQRLGHRPFIISFLLPRAKANAVSMSRNLETA